MKKTKLYAPKCQMQSLWAIFFLLFSFFRFMQQLHELTGVFSKLTLDQTRCGITRFFYKKTIFCLG